MGTCHVVVGVPRRHPEFSSLLQLAAVNQMELVSLGPSPAVFLGALGI